MFAILELIVTIAASIAAMWIAGVAMAVLWCILFYILVLAPYRFYKKLKQAIIAGA